MKNKKILRENMNKKLSNIPSLLKDNYSNEIMNKLKTFDILEKSNIVLSYSSFKNEPDSNDLNNYLLKNKTLLISQSNIKTHTLTLRKVENMNNLVKSTFGILEPIDGDIIPYKNVDCVVIPGIAFNLSGFRLGYGAGFFDRLFADTSFKGKKIGLFFDEQMINIDFQTKFDLPLDYIITPSKIYEF